MIDISGKVQVGNETYEQDVDAATDEASEVFDDPLSTESNIEEPLSGEVTQPIHSAEEGTAFFTEENRFEETNDGFVPVSEDDEVPMASFSSEELPENEVSEDFAESEVGTEVFASDNNEDQSFLEDDSPEDSFGSEELYEPPLENSEERIDESQEFEMAASPDTEPVDITEFANSESSNLDGGEYLYDLSVGRLDSRELREEFKYILMDEKLKLNFHEYMRKIHNGEVVISNLNPIKAKRIVEQLQYLDVSIKWEQKPVVMQEAFAESDEEDLAEELSGEVNV